VSIKVVSLLLLCDKHCSSRCLDRQRQAKTEILKNKEPRVIFDEAKKEFDNSEVDQDDEK
jgi:hypothetical protein